MTKFFTNTFPVLNLHKKTSSKSEIITQMIYGESFSIIKKNGKWLKIRIKEDGYKGFIKKKNLNIILNQLLKFLNSIQRFINFPIKRKE